MSRPADLQYTKSHEWIRVEGDVAIVGITDYAVTQLGDLAFVDLPEEGATIAAGDSFGEIESTKTVATLYAPVGGKIIAVNTELEDNLQRISDSPFDEGWMIRISLASGQATEGFLTAEEYAAHVAAEEEH